MTNENNIVSRSTKRSRFLEDLEMVDFLYDNENNLQCKIQPSTSYKINSKLTDENIKLTTKIDYMTFSTKYFLLNIGI
jgi:hypothetical protein